MPKDEAINDRAFEVKGHGISSRLFYIKPHVYHRDDIVALAPSNYVQYTKKPEEVTAMVTWRSFNGNKKLPKKETEKLKFPVIQNKVPMEPEEELKSLLAEEEGASETKRTLIIDTGRAKKHEPSQ